MCIFNGTSRALFISLLILALPTAYAEDCLEMGPDFDCMSEGGSLFYRSCEGLRLDAKNKDVIARAIKKEQAGNARAAFTVLEETSDFCMTEETGKRYGEMTTKLIRQFGNEEEKKGNFKESFEWFDRLRDKADANRVMMKHLMTKPEDLSILSFAFSHFKRHEVSDSLEKVRALALKKARSLLVTEEKSFADNRGMSRIGSLRVIQDAQEWLNFVEAPDNRLAIERAEKRGDTVAAESTVHFMEMAISYYRFAKLEGKIKRVQDKAKKLGDDAKNKGENEAAVEFYEVAGLYDVAKDLKKRTEAKQRIDEGKRQKKFKDEQGDLEKELGF